MDVLRDSHHLPIFYVNPTTLQPEYAQGDSGGVSVNLSAWSPSLLQYVQLTVDSSGNLLVAGGGGGGGGPATIADGADVVEGALADAAVVTDANGTVSGKLRGLVKILADIWDDANNRINVAVQNSPTIS